MPLHRRQLLVPNHDDAGRAAQGVQHGPVRTGHVGDHVRILVLEEVQQRANPFRVDGYRRRPVGRGEEVDPDFCARHQALEQRLVHALSVLERVEHRKPRLDAEEERGVAVRRVQVDVEHAPFRFLPERRRDVHRDRRRAHAPFAADEREQFSLGADLLQRNDPVDRLPEFVDACQAR